MRFGCLLLTVVVATFHGSATLDAVKTFGIRRGFHEPLTEVGEDLNVDEKAKVAVQYACLIANRVRAPPGSVASLAWTWGLFTTRTVRNIFWTFKYGFTIFSQRGRSTPDRIMDVLEYQQALVEIVVDKKGRVSGRRLVAAFKNKTGISVSRGTLVKYLKSLNLKICRRRYCPKMTEIHKMTRKRFGHKYRDENFDNWIDVDEKW